jgi:hypothetical protein
MDKHHDTGPEADKEQRNPQVQKSLSGNVDTPPRSTGEKETGSMPERVQGAMTSAVNTTQQLGSGVASGAAHMATDLVHGIGNLGGEVVAVVRDTANTAIAGVGSVGETAVHTVTGLLAELVGGIRDIGSAAMSGRANEAGRRHAGDVASHEASAKREQETTH